MIKNTAEKGDYKDFMLKEINEQSIHYKNMYKRICGPT